MKDSKGGFLKGQGAGSSPDAAGAQGDGVDMGGSAESLMSGMVSHSNSYAPGNPKSTGFSDVRGTSPTGDAS